MVPDNIDGKTPAEETVFDESGLTRRAWGLYNAYREVKDCDSNDHNVSGNVCDKLYDKIVMITGDAPPCESVELKRLIDFIIENLPNMTRPEIMPDLSNLIPDIIPTLPPTTPANILRDIIASLQGQIKNDTFADDAIIGGKESILLAHNDFTLALEALTAPPNIHGMIANMLGALKTFTWRPK